MRYGKKAEIKLIDLSKMQQFFSEFSNVSLFQSYGPLKKNEAVNILRLLMRLDAKVNSPTPLKSAICVRPLSELLKLFSDLDDFFFGGGGNYCLFNTNNRVVSNFRLYQPIQNFQIQIFQRKLEQNLSFSVKCQSAGVASKHQIKDRRPPALAPRALKTIFSCENNFRGCTSRCAVRYTEESAIAPPFACLSTEPKRSPPSKSVYWRDRNARNCVMPPRTSPRLSHEEAPLLFRAWDDHNPTSTIKRPRNFGICG